MSAVRSTLQPVRTAVSPQTIWSEVSEDDFRRSVVVLEEFTNAVPASVLNTSSDAIDKPQDNEKCLPVKLEKQTADDIAFITAVNEGAQSVAAVCLEQRFGDEGPSLVVRIAGMDVVHENVKGTLKDVVEQLGRTAINSFADRECSINMAKEEIFQLIVRQHNQKLLGRLRSKKWSKPSYLSLSHKKPLWQDFDNVIHRAQHMYPKRSERKERDLVEKRLTSLKEVFQSFETVEDDSPGNQLSSLVKATYDFCRLTEVRSFASKLDHVRATSQISAAVKTLHQLEKVGAYWRIADTLVSTARTYPLVFKDITLNYVTPYAGVPTTIAYESWAKTCHVHAEIQLVVDHALRKSEPRAEKEDVFVVPSRTIGTSKYLCYLCYLFLKYHDGFLMLNTHGRLYDQWTVPDLEVYEQRTRKKFATVLGRMNNHVCKQLEEIKEPIWRVEPMTSRQNLLGLEQD